MHTTGVISNIMLFGCKLSAGGSTKPMLEAADTHVFYRWPSALVPARSLQEWHVDHLARSGGACGLKGAQLLKWERAHA